MNFTRLRTIPLNMRETCKNMLLDDYDSVLHDVEKGFSEMYYISNDSFVILHNKPQSLNVVFLHGKELQKIADVILQRAKQIGVKRVNCWSKRAGMEKMLKKYGVEKTATYTEYTIQDLQNAKV